MCKSKININPYFPFSEVNPEKQWRTHICFDNCKPPAGSSDIDPGFTIDKRPECDETTKNKDKEIICLQPYKNECQVLQLDSEKCLDSAGLVCIDWTLIMISIILSNFVQVLF